MVTYSVIIATRNRPSLFAQALRSVLNQTCDAIEIIVVNDGSAAIFEAEYRAIIEAAQRPIHFNTLVRRPNGHGAGYTRNFAASLASGEYLCFLDDDDVWTDEQYLERVKFACDRPRDAPDLIFSNQAAFVGDRRKSGPIWLDGLGTRLEQSSRSSEEGGFYRVDVDDLVSANGFCHLNTLIVRRALFDAVGGIDEEIRWEEDHDLFLRLIDRAEVMLLSTAIVSRHNIADPTERTSLTASLNEVRRRLQQLRVFEKASLFAAHNEIRAHGQKHLGYTLKRLAEALATTKDYRGAAYYARQALGAAPTIKWAGYTILRMMVASVPIKRHRI